MRYNTINVFGSGCYREKAAIKEVMARMGMLVSLTDTIGRAMEVLAEKSRRAAKVSRLQSVIRSEERAANEAYLALGRYFYRHLRDQGGEEQQKLCRRIDKAMERVDRAVDKLEENAREEKGEQEQEPCTGCRQMSCATCAWYDGEDAGEEEEEGEDTAPVLEQPDQELEPESESEPEASQPEEATEEPEEPAIEWPVTPEKPKDSSCGSIPQPEVPQPARETPQARVIDRTAGQEKDREVADVDDVLQIPFL